MPGLTVFCLRAGEAVGRLRVAARIDARPARAYREHILQAGYEEKIGHLHPQKTQVLANACFGLLVMLY